MLKSVFNISVNKLLVTMLLMAIFMVSGTSVTMAADYEINHYDIQMDVALDNSYLITETIDVQFYLPQHGIFRDIPKVTYKGNRVLIEDVTVEGIPFESTNAGRNLRLQIGDPYAFAPEIQRYVIRYRYIIGDDRLPDMDELYFNLIGTGWDTAIRKVTFGINMPKTFDSEPLNITYGVAGSTENSEIRVTVEGNRISGELLKELNPGEALTVALPLPQGYFSEAKLQESVLDKLSQFWWLVDIILLIIGACIWFFMGRNRRVFPAVEFYPPKDLNPAETGYLFDGQVNPYDISSLIVYWADRGALRIIETIEEEGLIFKKNKTVLSLERLVASIEGPEHETMMFNKLFDTYAKDNIVCLDDLENSFYTVSEAVKRSLIKEMKNGIKGPVFEKKGWVVVLMIKLMAFLIAIFLVVQVVAFFDPTFSSFHMVFGFIGGAFFSMPLWGMAKVIHEWNKMLPGRKLKALVPAVLGMVILIGVTGVITFYTELTLQAMTASGFTMILYLMAADGKRRSAKGDRYTESILGFREFLLHAEKDRIEALVSENPTYFFNVLAYAMVLGVTDKWVKKFEEIAITPPDWYQPHSNNSGSFNPVLFTSNINTNMHAMANTMSSSPNSSGSGGSSGGGSSGGGSGGGGGGSW